MVCYFGFIDTEMVHRGIDQDPLAEELKSVLPRPLRRRLTPDQAGEAVARAVERRAPRVIVPPAWRVMYALRGLLGPVLDRHMERNARLQSITSRLDDRAGEEQPTTA
jgi:hypothetical protein